MGRFEGCLLRILMILEIILLANVRSQTNNRKNTIENDYFKVAIVTFREKKDIDVFWSIVGKNLPSIKRESIEEIKLYRFGEKLSSGDLYVLFEKAYFTGANLKHHDFYIDEKDDYILQPQIVEKVENMIKPKLKNVEKILINKPENVKLKYNPDSLQIFEFNLKREKLDDYVYLILEKTSSKIDTGLIRKTLNIATFDTLFYFAKGGRDSVYAFWSKENSTLPADTVFKHNFKEKLLNHLIKPSVTDSVAEAFEVYRRKEHELKEYEVYEVTNKKTSHVGSVYSHPSLILPNPVKISNYPIDTTTVENERNMRRSFFSIAALVMVLFFSL